MEAKRQILCLNMIVKNEAPVIARCLASVRPIIDYWVIVDTGSTDGTQDAIRTLMADLPGELHEHPWRDFAHNRTEALELAQSHGEYVLFIDADDVLEFEPNFEMPTLQADSYMLRIADPSFSYNRTQIVRATVPWRWRGVLHEFLTCDDARSSGLLEGLRLRVNHDGARRRDPQTYRRDAEILYAALQTESDPFMQSRYQFYLAQCYRDCGENEKALQAYLKRAELGFSVEEVFISLYYAAKLQGALGRPFDEVIATYLRAANAVPSRAEALHGASLYCRLSQRYKEGYEIVKRAVAKGASLSGEAPHDLFVESWIYEYGLLDEFAVNAYWACAYQDCLDACELILRERKCPAAERPRIEANAAFARQQLRIAALASEIKELEVDRLNMLLRDQGKMILPLGSLYDWQLNPHPGGPVFKPIALPNDAREYLTPNNPKLLDLKRRYAKCDPNVTTPWWWGEGHVRTEDIAYFRGDNAYLWQVRDPNCNIMGYTLSTYYVKSIDSYNLLDQLTEDEAFGIFTFEVAGRTITRDLLDSVMEINFLDRHLGLMSRREITVLDIGAGYGRLAYRMSTSVPGLKEYLCADAVPESTFISDFYLRYRNAGHKTKVIALDQIEQALTANKIDIALNIHCFSECHLKSVEWWVSRLAGAKVNYLFIVPNDFPSNGLECADGNDYLPVLSHYGYRLLVREHKYSDPIVQKYAASPKYYFLFGLG